MKVMWLIKKHNIVKLNNDILKMKMLRAAMTNATKRKIFQRKKKYNICHEISVEMIL